MLRKNLILFFLFLRALSIDAQNDSITTTYQLEGVKIYGSKQPVNAYNPLIANKCSNWVSIVYQMR